MIFLLTILFSYFTYSQMLSEFQPIQSESEPEWIEIYNENDFELSLENLTISDNVSSNKLSSGVIGAKSYFIITQNKQLLLSKYDLDENKVLEFNFPTLNNNTDRILLDYNGIFKDSVSYDMKNYTNGKSIERVDFQKGFSVSNWKSSIDKNNATPLKENSVRIVDFNLSILSMEYDGTYLSIQIESNGKTDLEDLDFYLYFDWNFNKEIEQNEIIYSQINLSISKFVNLKYRFEDIMDINDIFGLIKVAAKIINSYDEKKSDDYFELTINIPPNNSSILFNEIMFDPSTNQCEYIELYNTSNFDIELSNITIHDQSNKDKTLDKYTDNFILNSKDYVVIAADSTILHYFKDIIDKNKLIITNKNLSLNNSGDELYLKWDNKKIIDSVFYQESWHSENTLNTKGISLEKKGLVLESNSKENWTSSNNDLGGSPSVENTVLPQDNGKYGLKLPKNPFSFIENDLIKISYFSPYQNSIINLSIYDKNGLKIGVISELDRGAYSGEIKWNGKIKNKSLTTGSYILYLECVNADTQELYIDKELFVIVN